jgi:hypothetical protein
MSPDGRPRRGPIVVLHEVFLGSSRLIRGRAAGLPLCHGLAIAASIVRAVQKAPPAVSAARIGSLERDRAISARAIEIIGVGWVRALMSACHPARKEQAMPLNSMPACRQSMALRCWGRPRNFYTTKAQYPRYPTLGRGLVFSGRGCTRSELDFVSPRSCTGGAVVRESWQDHRPEPSWLIHSPDGRFESIFPVLDLATQLG